MTDDRARLLAGLPLTERRLDLAGVPTVVLEGGSGAPMVLLHGPGEFGLTWLPVLEQLARAHRLVVPDLPGHGASGLPDGDLDTDVMLRWLDELIARACPAPPVVVGRVVGGALAARHAIEHPGRSAGLVLVDTLGLVPFAPNPRFMLAMQRFLAQPTEQTYERFMALCAFDVDGARQRLGNRWEPFARYAVDLAARPGVQAAMGAVIGSLRCPSPRSHSTGSTSQPRWSGGARTWRLRSQLQRQRPPATDGPCTSSRTPATTRPWISPTPSSKRSAMPSNWRRPDDRSQSEAG
jgi:pimeloyl-ACP methyl ester carboxylesterase